MHKIHYETILKVNGIVLARPIGMENDKMTTGRIEVMMDSLEILNPAKNHLPMEVRDFNRSKEQLRLEYRYIDLRFADMQHNLRLRSNVLMKMREFLINKSAFVEVETPTLFGRTPGVSFLFLFSFIYIRELYEYSISKGCSRICGTHTKTWTFLFVSTKSATI